MRAAVLLSSVMVSLAAVSCAPPPPSGTRDKDADGPRAAPAVEATGAGVTATIDGAGGTVVLEDGEQRWTLDVPATSLPEAVAITLRPATSSALPGVATVLLEPTGLAFRNGAVLTYSGLDRPAIALSFEPGERGIDVTFASSDEAGVRFVLEHFSAAAVADGTERLRTALDAFTPEQVQQMQDFADLADEEEEQQAIALADEGRRLVEPSIAGASESVQRVEAAVTTLLNWRARVEGARALEACDGIRCVFEGSCTNEQECSSQRCEAGGCVRTLGVVIERLRLALVDEIRDLIVAITAPTCDDRSLLPRATPEFWIEGPERASQQIQLLGEEPPPLALCAVPRVSMTGPATLGDDPQFTVAIRPFITTPTGEPAAAATVTLTATGATPVGGDDLAYDGTNTLSVVFDRGADPPASARVAASVTFAQPWTNLGEQVQEQSFNRTAIEVIARATVTEVQSAGQEVDICVTMLSDGAPVLVFNVVDADVEGLGSTRNDSAGTGSGGEVCGVFYVAPSPLPAQEAAARVRVRARSSTGEEGDGTVEVALVPGAINMSVRALPPLLTFDDSTSSVCVTMLDGDAPLESFDATFELLTPLGAVDPSLSVAGPTEGCVIYRSPGVLPETREVVRIRVNGTSAGQQRTADVEIVLNKNAPSLSMSLPSTVRVDEDATVCGFVFRGAAPAEGSVLSFSRVSGGGTLAASEAPTDVNGQACTVFTAPSTEGTTVLRVALTEEGSTFTEDASISVELPPPASLFGDFRGPIDCEVFDAARSPAFQNFTCGESNYGLSMTSGGGCNRDICFVINLSSTNCGFTPRFLGAQIDFIDESRVDFSRNESEDLGFTSSVDALTGAATLTPNVLELTTSRSEFNSADELRFSYTCVYQAPRE